MGNPTTAPREKSSMALTAMLVRDQLPVMRTELERYPGVVVLGASVPRIAYLLFKEVMGLVVVTSLLTAPIVYFLIDHWLQAFAYRTDINAQLFVLAGPAALLVALSR